MNKEQMLLTKVAEECSELSKECLKSIRFGVNNHKPGDVETNIDRIYEEFKDLMVAICYLETQTGRKLTKITDIETTQRIAKIDKYLQVSRDLGILKD